MEKLYWLGRKRASLKAAQNALSAEARLIHFDLAGRYSVKAVSAATATIDFASALPTPILVGTRSGAPKGDTDA
jgi:hypothetical protein